MMQDALGFNDLEYLVPYVCTLFLIVAKLIFGVYLYQKYKNSEEKNYFVKGASVLMFLLGGSRIAYFIFDFYLTRLNPDLFWQYPNVWLWKTGNFLSGAGISYLLYVVDRKVYNFKFKGILAYGNLAIALVQFLWPISGPESYNLVSTIGFLSILFALLIPITFLYVGIKSTGDLRKMSFLMVLGILLYSFAGQLLNESLLEMIGATKGTTIRVFFFSFVPLFKIVALGIVTYSATKFRI